MRAISTLDTGISAIKITHLFVLDLDPTHAHEGSPSRVPRHAQNQMAVEVLEQLRRISGQQSKIRKMREKLALFRQVSLGLSP